MPWIEPLATFMPVDQLGDQQPERLQVAHQVAC